MRCSKWEVCNRPRACPVLLPSNVKAIRVFIFSQIGNIHSIDDNIGFNSNDTLVQISCSVKSDFLQPHGLQQARPPCLSPTPGVYSNSCSLSQWCHPTISSSAVPISILCHHLQTFPASGYFQMSQFFASDGQSYGISASTSVLPVNIQGWFPLWWTGWISLQSKGLSRVFSNTTVQKHQFFITQFSLYPNSHPYKTNGKTIALTIQTFVGKVVSLFSIRCLGWS